MRSDASRLRARALFPGLTAVLALSTTLLCAAPIPSPAKTDSSQAAPAAAAAKAPGASKVAPKTAPKKAPAAKTPAPSPVAVPALSHPARDTTRHAPKDSAKAAIDTVPKPLRDLSQKALRVPEKLLFDIIWGGWSFRWVTAGQATLELLPTDRPETWKIRSLAWCNGFFRTFYPVRDTVISLVDSRGIYPIRFEKHLHEGSYNASLSASYDQARHIVTTQDTSFSIEPFTHDVMSAFYFIRTQNLKVGDTLLLAAVSGKKKYNLKVLCHGRETIKVAAGTFKTLVVEPVLKEDGLFKAKGKLTIWVTDDETHMPVKMESKIPVGSIKAELVSRS
jgi:hypothetical protein